MVLDAAGPACGPALFFSVRISGCPVLVVAKMSKMVEHVADAVEAALPDKGYAPDAEKIARAAIAAMREPTFEMRKAGNISITDKSYSIAAAWQAMIDAALEGG